MTDRVGIHEASSLPMVIVVMGVSGCGKSTLARRLARSRHARFLEGDAFHSVQNTAKMSAGIPLRDADRWPWLERLGRCAARSRHTRPVVISCSALKRRYRDRLRALIAPPLVFVCLDVPVPELRRRLRSRTGHFMPARLLVSQLRALELPAVDEAAITLCGHHAVAPRLRSIWDAIARV